MSNRFRIPRLIVSGENALPEAGPELKALGEKALIVTDKGMQQLGNVAHVTQTLKNNGVEFSVFDGVNFEPTDEVVYQGVDCYKSEGCDFLIGVGGGSPIDAMKAIAAVVTLDQKAGDLFGAEIQGTLPPMVAIPTTAGTGSEATQFTIITDSKTQVKMLLKGPCLMPDIAIVDYVFTLSAPATLTAFTGLDALCHGVEAYISRRAHPLSDSFALSAVKRIFNYLAVAYENPGDKEARLQMALAATEAGIAFSNASVTVIHGMSRPIGALFHVPHGLSNAMIMNRCLRYVRNEAKTRFADIARYCGMVENQATDDAAADAFLDAVSALVEKLCIPSLKAHGIDKEAFLKQVPKMSGDALKSGSPGNTLRDLTQEDLVFLYHSLWD